VWRDGTAHFVAVSACSVDADGVEYLEIGDPLQVGTATMTYDEFLTNYQGQGTWTNSYFTVLGAGTPSGGAALASTSLGAPVAP
jgi:hypothetical protein